MLFEKTFEGYQAKEVSASQNSYLARKFSIHAAFAVEFYSVNQDFEECNDGFANIQIIFRPKAF